MFVLYFGFKFNTHSASAFVPFSSVKDHPPVIERVKAASLLLPPFYAHLICFILALTRETPALPPLTKRAVRDP